MNDEDIKNIARFVLLIGVIICIVSIVVPWGEATLGIFGAADFNTWGVEVSQPFSGQSESFYYFDLLKDSSPLAEYLKDYNVQIFCSILVLPLALFSLTIAIYAGVFFSKHGKDLPLRAGLFSIISVILFFVGVQTGLLKAFEPLSAYYEWGIGFFFMILAFILFISSYLIMTKTTD